MTLAAGSPCRVYWGSHGCKMMRGHDGPHDCGCCDSDCKTAHAVHGTHADECVSTAPYYGPDTQFYGEDAPDLCRNPTFCQGKCTGRCFLYDSEETS